jgi:peptidoglycan/xylan/chitin deacetylase (PgdA/CDA1 family)
MTFFRAPNFLSVIFRHWIWQLDASESEGAIYLTFDDGPTPEITPWILDYLKEHNIKANFFCVGQNVQKNREIYQRILSEGHVVGNHTMHHERGTRTKMTTYIQSVEDASTEITSKLFRPPYGRLTWRQSQLIRKKYKIIMWSWLSHDFDQTIPVDRILAKAKKELRSRDIVVFHDNVKSSDRIKQILPEFIQIIQTKNLNPSLIKF